MAFLSRLIFALFGMAFALLLTVGVLCWLAFYTVFASVRWLVTGQKPQVVMMWQQIQAMRNNMQTGQGTRWSREPHPSDGPWHEESGRPRSRDIQADGVEDVVVREIQDKRSSIADQTRP